MKISPGLFKQVLLTMAASLGYMTIGLIRGWSSTGIPSMEKANAYLIPTNEAISWVSAIPPLGAFLGSLVAGPLLHHIGRKRTLMISGPIFSFGWLMIGHARALNLLILARMLTGFCAGLVTPSAQVYVSECAYPEIRGFLGSLPALFMAIGVLVSYILGSWLRWDHLAFASALFPAVMFILLIPLPESPTWLSDHNRHEEAEKVLKWLNRQEKSASDDPNIFTITQNKSDSEKAQPSSTILTTLTKRRPSLKTAKMIVQGRYTKEALTQRSVLIPFGLVTGILIFQQISGIDTILFYTVSIFSLSHSSVDDYTATIIVGLVQVIATFVSIFIIDHAGRKPLLIISGLFMGISMALLGVYFYIQEIDSATASRIALTPIISLVIFMASFSIGYCNIPYILMGELIPLAQRSVLSSIAGALNLGSMFLILKTYPNIKEIVGTKGVFWLYSIFCFLSCVFVIAFLPETKQKTLEEIEEYFEMKNKKATSEKTETPDATIKSSEAAQAESTH